MRPRKSITDSPWFWVHLFAVSALLTTFVFRDKLVELRTQRAQNFDRRQAVQERAAGRDVDVELTTRETERWQLGFLFALLGAVAIFAWWRLWQTHLRTPPPSPPDEHRYQTGKATEQDAKTYASDRER